jgi:hypothetical protein
MRNRQLDDGTYVVTTAPDLSALLPAALLAVTAVIVGVGALVGFAMSGNVVAGLILGSLTSPVFIVLGVKLANSSRRTELDGLARGTTAGNEQWRLDMQERLALTDELATLQSRQAKTTQNTVAAMMTAAGNTQDAVAALDLDPSYYDLNGN